MFRRLLIEHYSLAMRGSATIEALLARKVCYRHHIYRLNFRSDWTSTLILEILIVDDRNVVLLEKSG
jgi:hypothetical protein